MSEFFFLDLTLQIQIHIGYLSRYIRVTPFHSKGLLIILVRQNDCPRIVQPNVTQFFGAMLGCG